MRSRDVTRSGDLLSRFRLWQSMAQPQEPPIVPHARCRHPVRGAAGLGPSWFSQCSLQSLQKASKNGCAVVTTRSTRKLLDGMAGLQGCRDWRYCGHGVGKLFHGPPKVPHYKRGPRAQREET